MKARITRLSASPSALPFESAEGECELPEVGKGFRFQRENGDRLTLTEVRTIWVEGDAVTFTTISGNCWEIRALTPHPAGVRLERA